MELGEKLTRLSAFHVFIYSLYLSYPWVLLYVPASYKRSSNTRSRSSSSTRVWYSFLPGYCCTHQPATRATATATAAAAAAAAAAALVSGIHFYLRVDCTGVLPIYHSTAVCIVQRTPFAIYLSIRDEGGTPFTCSRAVDPFGT